MSSNKILIHSCFKDYSVEMVEDLNFLYELTQKENTEFIIGKIVYSLYRMYFEKIPDNRLFLIETSEEAKVIDTAFEIYERMTEIPAKRNSCIVSIGGGIIQDITGFVASTLYRGIKWTFVPTTLLAACDSCIGGKTSLNYKKYKNLLGTFYPPDEIISCPAFFKTLTKKDYESGLGEVVKFNIMAGAKGLRNIEDSINLLTLRNERAVKECVISSLTFKKDFIEKDEFDKGERIKLNFAHTFGHGIETITNYQIPHGTAVAIGMVMANYISVKRGLLAIDTARRSEKLLKEIIHIDYDFKKLSFDSFINAIKKDKKQVGNQMTAVLMTDAAKDLRIVHDIELTEVKDAIDHFCNIYY